jgi:predicted nuclease with TOPRIM domain
MAAIDISQVDLNSILVVVTVILLVAGAPRVLKGAQYKARDEEKEKIIRMKQETIDTLEERLQIVKEDRDRAVSDTQVLNHKFQELEKGFEGLKQRFMVQSQYTAENAVQMFEKLLRQHSNEAALRHHELMKALEVLTGGKDAKS